MSRELGKPTKMTDEFVTKYLALVRIGIPPYLAAEELELGRVTLFEWLKKGGYPRYKGLPRWVSPDQAQEPYSSFVEQTLQAEAKSHNKVATVVYKKAEKDADFGLKWLRFRYPDNWHPNRNETPQVVEVQQQIVMTYEDFKRLQQERAEGDNHGPEE